MRVPLSIRRFAVDLLTVALLALALALFAVAPGGTAPTQCPDRRPAAPSLASSSGTTEAADRDVLQPRTGIDLSLRVWNLRVEFPWMRALPISPGRHIVISLFERGPAD